MSWLPSRPLTECLPLPLPTTEISSALLSFIKRSQRQGLNLSLAAKFTLLLKAALTKRRMMLQRHLSILYSLQETTTGIKILSHSLQRLIQKAFTTSRALTERFLNNTAADLSALHHVLKGRCLIIFREGFWIRRGKLRLNINTYLGPRTFT